MALANVNNQKRQVLSGLLADRPIAAVYYGDIYYATDTTLWYIYTPSGWITESIPGVIATLSGSIPSGEAHIGEVGGNTYPIIVTPVIGAATFTAGDFVGGKLTLANAGRVAGGSGIINSLIIVDGAKQGVTKGALRIYLFNADLTETYADNAVESFSLADLQKLCPGGVIDVPISCWEATLTNASITISESLRNLNIPYKCAAGTSIYAIMRTLSDPTYTTDCLQLTFGLLRD